MAGLLETVLLQTEVQFCLPEVGKECHMIKKKKVMRSFLLSSPVTDIANGLLNLLLWLRLAMTAATLSGQCSGLALRDVVSVEIENTHTVGTSGLLSLAVQALCRSMACLPYRSMKPLHCTGVHRSLPSHAALPKLLVRVHCPELDIPFHEFKV